MASTQEDVKQEPITLEIVPPIEVIPSEHYKLVIKDAQDTQYFFLPNGNYDGYCCCVPHCPGIPE